MIITGRTQMISQMYSLDESLKFFKDAGYDGIEFCFEDFNFKLRPDYLEDFFIKHTVERAMELGMKIASVGNHLEYVYDDFMFEFLKRTVPKVREFGTDILITASSDRTAQKIHNPDHRKKYKERLGELLTIGDFYGVRIAVEPEPPHLIVSTEDFLQLCDEIGKDNLACNFDIGHAFLTDDDINESIRKLGSRIAHAHVENLKRGEHLHRFPEDGDIDLRSCFETLKEIGFTGAMALDLYVFEYDKVCAECAGQLRRML